MSHEQLLFHAAARERMLRGRGGSGGGIPEAGGMAGGAFVLSEPEGSGRGFLAVRLAVELGHRIREGSRRIDPAAWRSWRRWMGWGAAGAAALCMGLLILVRWLEAGGGLAWERAFLNALAERLTLHSAVVLEIPGSGMVLWPLAMFGAAWAAWYRRVGLAASLLAGYVVIGAVVYLGWIVWGRERPSPLYHDVVGFGELFNSFPSGHSANSLFVYGFLAYLWSRASPRRLEGWIVAALAAVLVTVVTLARLRMLAHWPTDCLGGVVLGAAWLLVVVRAYETVEPRPSARPEWRLAPRRGAGGSPP